jgi:hypothetical protein
MPPPGRRCLNATLAHVIERYVIDSNIFDRFEADSTALALAEQLVAEGKLELLTTHAQIDELSRIGDADRLGRLLSVPARRVPTSGLILGVSRLDEARLSEPEPIESIRRENWDKYTLDALIAATADYERAGLVTEDRTLRARAIAQGINAVDWAAFRSRLGELSEQT